MSWYQIVLVPNCPGPNCPVPNCPGPCCPEPNYPDTIYIYIYTSSGTRRCPGARKTINFSDLSTHESNLFDYYCDTTCFLTPRNSFCLISASAELCTRKEREREREREIHNIRGLSSYYFTKKKKKSEKLCKSLEFSFSTKGGARGLIPWKCCGIQVFK